jgi:hypothetical protein
MRLQWQTQGLGARPRRRPFCPAPQELRGAYGYAGPLSTHQSLTPPCGPLPGLPRPPPCTRFTRPCAAASHPDPAPNPSLRLPPPSQEVLAVVPGGYLVRVQEGDLKYMVAFGNSVAALEWCLLTQVLRVGGWGRRAAPLGRRPRVPPSRPGRRRGQRACARFAREC